MPELTRFHLLTFVTERDGVTVGRSDRESYFVFPSEGAELLRRLVDGMPVAEAARWYESAFGERIDMTDFMTILAKLEFIKNADEGSAVLPEVRYQALGRMLFSRPAWLCYAALMAAALVVMIRYPHVRPHPQAVYFSSSLILIQVVFIFAQVPTMCWHEWFHVMAGRRLGLPTRLSVGRRLYFLVFETHLTSLLGVPPRQRYLPFLAGMLADLLAFCGLTLAASLDPHKDASWLARLALAIAYIVLLRLAWQGMIFLRTDLYYVLTTLLGCTDLASASSAYIRDRLRQVCWPWAGARSADAVGPWTDDERWSARDRTMAPWFARLSVVGGAALLALLSIGVIPVLTTFADRLVSELAHGTAGGSRFWGATATVALVLVQVVVLPVLAGRRGRRSDDLSSPSEVAA